MNEPPVAVLKLAAVEPPWTTEAEVDDAFSERVGKGVTVNAYVTDCVPVLSLPVMTILLTPAAIAEAVVAVTVAVVPGRIEPGLIGLGRLGGQAEVRDEFWAQRASKQEGEETSES